MTTARSQLIHPNTAGLYHCVQRCVRRAWLCGVDEYTGESFEHRKLWVEERIALVGSCFAVAIQAYAVMSNHLHLVLEFDPAAINTWSDDDVATHWIRLYPPRDATEAAFDAKKNNLLADAARLEITRQRLGDVSWVNARA